MRVYKTKEAIQLLKQGKKIRFEEWGNENRVNYQYIRESKFGFIVNETGDVFITSADRLSLYYHNDDNWFEIDVDNDSNFNEYDDPSVNSNFEEFGEELIVDVDTYKKLIAEENKVSKQEEILPCCKCGMNDKWNSKGKDGKYYCYIHC